MVDKHSRESTVAEQTGKDDALTRTHRPVDFMPGADDGEGLLILSDGRLRKVIRCDGLNSRSFDVAALKKIAAVFSEVAASLKVEIQFAFSNTDLSEPDFLARYRSLVSTDSECIRWLSECSEQWFKQVYDSHQVQKQQPMRVSNCDSFPIPWAECSARLEWSRDSFTNRNPGGLRAANYEDL